MCTGDIMIEKDKIPKDIQNVIFGYGSQFLIECLYVWDREEYKRAVQIARPKPSGERSEEEKQRDIDNVEYFGTRMTVLHTAWVALEDNEEKHPFII